MQLKLTIKDNNTFNNITHNKNNNNNNNNNNSKRNNNNGNNNNNNKFNYLFLPLNSKVFLHRHMTHFLAALLNWITPIHCSLKNYLLRSAIVNFLQLGLIQLTNIDSSPMLYQEIGKN